MKTLVQARVKLATKNKLVRLAKASDRKLASYVALILEDHVRSVDVKTIQALSRAWRDVDENRSNVVDRKDGPR